MRMDTRSGPTAEQVVNEMGERELANLIYEYGEERRSRTVARAIVRGRPVTSTAQLARIVASAVPPMKFIHPATRTFQALRIFVNQELHEIRALFEAAPKLLKPSARLVVISFHSLEDRIAKDNIREGAQKGIWNVLTKKARNCRRRRDQPKPAIAQRKAESSGTEIGMAERGELEMAACVTTYFETGRGLGAQIAERNAEMMAQQAQRRRRVRMPEYLLRQAFRQLAPRQGLRPGSRARDARLLGRRRRALLAHHDLRPAALLAPLKAATASRAKSRRSTSCAKRIASCA